MPGKFTDTPSHDKSQNIICFPNSGFPTFLKSVVKSFFSVLLVGNRKQAKRVVICFMYSQLRDTTLAQAPSQPATYPQKSKIREPAR